MEDSGNSSRDLKKRLCILEDENGLELSLGLSLGNSSSDKVKSTEIPVAAAAADGGSFPNIDDEQRRIGSSNNPWNLDARRKPPPPDSAFRLREFIPDVSQQQIAAAWGQMNKEPPGSRISHPSCIPMSEIAKYLAASAKPSQPVQPQAAEQPPPAAAAGDEEPQDLESSEQQKKFSQHQEARKKRKMAMDEQKKKPRDDDKPDEPIHRVSSLGAFHNHQTSASMTALASQLMRRTTSDPALLHALQQQQQQEDSGKDQAGQETGNISSNGLNNNNGTSNNGTSSSENLLGMWQLGTTVDVPSAESINPELSSIKPGCSADLPWVAASGPGGKSVSGVAYKLFQGQYKIVCSCHGLHMSPADFVKHAAASSGVSGTSNGNGGGMTGGDAMSMLSQVTPA